MYQWHNFPGEDSKPNEAKQTTVHKHMHGRAAALSKRTVNVVGQK